MSWAGQMEDRDRWRRDYSHVVLPFLRENQIFEGGRLCQWCRQNGLREPWHHNEWVSMPGILRSSGLIEPIGRTRPTTSHSHIDELTLWRSTVFNPALARQQGLFGVAA